MSIDKESLIIVQAITEGIAVACKRLQQLETRDTVNDEEEQPEEEPEEDDEQ